MAVMLALSFNDFGEDDAFSLESFLSSSEVRDSVRFRSSKAGGIMAWTDKLFEPESMALCESFSVDEEVS
jgi:hypothetical protein